MEYFAIWLIQWKHSAWFAYGDIRQNQRFLT
jgi:hypothetical protein